MEVSMRNCRKKLYMLCLLCMAALCIAGIGCQAEAANKKQVKSGFVKTQDGWYYYNSKGKMQTGWKTIGSKRFYFEKSGASGEKGKMVTGWKKIGKKTYYFRKSGKKATIGAAYKSEWKKLNGQDYYFDKNGAWYQDVPTNEEFIQTIAPMAVKDMKKSGILASVTMAQAIHESAYGTSSLALEGKNLFGIKAGGWSGKTFSKKTQEYIGGKWYTVTAKFRAYSSYQKSISDHSDYLNTAMNGASLRYRGLKGCRNYKKAFQIIKNGGYATDPQYVSKLCKIVKKYNLTKYDKMK